MNPLKGGFVFRPEDYTYSSAVDYSGSKGYWMVWLFVNEYRCSC